MKKLLLAVVAVVLVVPALAQAQDKKKESLGGLSKNDAVVISKGVADEALKKIALDKSVVSGLADSATTIGTNAVNGADNIVLGTAENAGAFVSNLAGGNLAEAGKSLGKTIASPVVGIAQVSVGLGAGIVQIGETAVSAVWNGFLGLFGAADSAVRGENSHRREYTKGLTTTTGFAYPTSRKKTTSTSQKKQGMKRK